MSKHTSGKHYGCGRGGVKPPTLTVEPLFEDGFRATNPADYYSPALLFGTARHVEPGALVTVTLEDHTWQARVDKNGDWSLPIPPSAITSLLEVERQLTISVTNRSGKTTELTRTVEIPDMSNGAAAGVGIGPIAGNDVLTGREKTHGQVISGLTEFAEKGSLVTVMLEGKSWQVPIDANGSWHLTLPPEVLKTLTPGEHTISVMAVADYDGSRTLIDRTFTVTKGHATPCAAEITLNSITSDDVLTAVERQSGLIVSGTVDNVPNGSQVWVQLGDDIYAATVKNHHWQTTIPAGDLATLQNGSAAITAWVQDVNETATVVREFIVAKTATAPYLTIDPPYNSFAIDDEQWAMFPALLSGTAINVTPGTVVAVVFGTKNYQPRVDEEGKWHVPVSVADLMALSPGEYRLQVITTNYLGETTSLERTIRLDDIFSSTEPRIAIGAVSTDDVISARESQTDLIISGASLNVAAGELVSVTFPGALPGQTFTGRTGNYGEWSVTIPASTLQTLGSGDVEVKAQLGNGALSDSRNIDIITGGEPELAPTITLDSLRQGSLISQEEISAYKLHLSGKVANVDNNSEIWVQLGHEIYVTNVFGDTWALTVPNDARLEQGPTSIIVTVRDGDETASTVLPVTVVQKIPLKIDLLPGGDEVMHYDAPWDHIFTGTVRDDTRPVTLTLNGKSYRASVTDHEWMVRIPGEEMNALPVGDVPLTVKTGSFTAGITLTVNGETQASPLGPTLDAVSGDNLITYEEKGNGLRLSGGVLDADRVTADAIVDVELRGQHYQSGLTLVNGELNWSVWVPFEETKLLPMNGTQMVTVTLLEEGQPSIVTARILEFTRDTDPSDFPPQVAIDPWGDNIINATEAQSDQTIGGTTHYIFAGSAVTVTLGELSWQTVTDNDGRWKVTIPAGALATIPDGDYQLNVTVAHPDNPEFPGSSSASRSVTFDTGHAPANSVLAEAVPDLATHAEEETSTAFNAQSATVDNRPDHGDGQTVHQEATPEDAHQLSLSALNSLIADVGEMAHNGLSESGALPTTLADLGLSGGESAIAALLAQTAEAKESAAETKTLDASLEPISLALAASGDAWSLAARGVEEGQNYAPPVPPDLMEHLAHQLA